MSDMRSQLRLASQGHHRLELQIADLEIGDEVVVVDRDHLRWGRATRRTSGVLLPATSVHLQRAATTTVATEALALD